MLSLDYIRENKDKVVEAAKNKNRPIEIEKIIKLDDVRRELISKIQVLRTKRNQAPSGKPTPDQIASGKKLKEEIKALEEELKKTEDELNLLVARVPNVPLPEVPVGKSEADNVEIKKWGEPKKFSFAPRSHMDLGKALDIIDLERGVKVSGFRGYFLKNEGALLHSAILFYVFSKLAKNGYQPVIAPSIVKGRTLFGSGQFPWGESEVYKLNDEDAYLSGTAEIPVTSFYADEILAEGELPKKFVAFSPCYRREAGAYGKDTKGLYRLHEFWKVEQVVIARADIEEAKKLHEELQSNTESVLKDLGLPYRVLNMCTGDMGEPQIKKYDTEVFMPYKNGYGEIASNSIMGDFQTRRLKIKYRQKDGSTKYCFSLNDTATPSPRILIAILENFQTEDGSVVIPEVLRPLMGTDMIKQKGK